MLHNLSPLQIRTETQGKPSSWAKIPNYASLLQFPFCSFRNSSLQGWDRTTLPVWFRSTVKGHLIQGTTDRVSPPPCRNIASTGLYECESVIYESLNCCHQALCLLLFTCDPSLVPPNVSLWCVCQKDRTTATLGLKWSYQWTQVQD